MKQKHIFQVVQPQQQSLNQRFQLSSRVQKNIFMEVNLHRVSESQLHNSKHYEMVGLKQLQSFKSKSKKKTKASTKEDLPSEQTIERQNNTKTKSRFDLLNKKEVIDCLPKLSKQQSYQFMKRVKRSSWIDLFQQKNTKNNSNNSKEFSVFRLKTKLNQHQQDWRKLLKTRKKEKFPSLGNSIVLYQSRIEDMQKKQMDENLVNLKSQFWTGTLRSNKNIGDICGPKRQVKTLHEDGMKAKGASKLNREINWINLKQQQGFKFKNCQKSSLQQSKIQLKLR